MHEPVLLAVYRKRYFNLNVFLSFFHFLLATFSRLPGVRCPCLRAMKPLGYCAMKKNIRFNCPKTRRNVLAMSYKSLKLLIDFVFSDGSKFAQELLFYLQYLKNVLLPRKHCHLYLFQVTMYNTTE